MRDEIECASKFVTGLLKSVLAEEALERFQQALENLMFEHYDSHWYVNQPNRGSGYRCVRNVPNVMDPLLIRAAKETGVRLSLIKSTLPRELTLWVDPETVCYRFGEDGSIGYLETVSNTSSDDSGMEESDSPSSSPITCNYNNNRHHQQSHNRIRQQEMSSGLVEGAPQPCSTEYRTNIYYSGRERHYYPEVM